MAISLSIPRLADAPSPYYAEFSSVAPPPEEIAIAGDRRNTASAVVLRDHLQNKGPSGSLDFWDSVVALHELSNDKSIPCFIANRLLAYDRRHVSYSAPEGLPPEPDSLIQILEDIATHAKARNERRKREESAAQFLQVLYAEGQERAHSDGIYAMINWLFTLQEQAKFDYIDKIFQSADTQMLAPEYLIGLLRATYVERSMIPGWVNLLDRVEAEFGARGRVDIGELLQGLRPR
jgi:hypothetical protein